MKRFNPLENADSARTRALECRNNGGGGTIRVFATTTAMVRGQAKPTAWDALYFSARADWQSASREAANDFARACLNGPGSDVDSYVIEL